MDKLWLANDESKLQFKPDSFHFAQFTLKLLNQFNIIINPVQFNPVKNIGRCITTRDFDKMKTSHFKYIDDLTLAETINLKKQLVEIQMQYPSHQATMRGLVMY